MNYTGPLTEEIEHFINSVYHLRYEVLVQEQGKRPKYANHLLGTVQEPLDETGMIIVKIVNDALRGAARINQFRDMTDPFFLQCYNTDFFREEGLLSEVMIISRMMMQAAFRGTASFADLAIATYRWVLNSSASLILIECTPSYAPVFNKLGFVTYNGSFQHPDGMEVSPMILDTNNRDWLRKTGSIFLNTYPASFVAKPEVTAVISKLTGHMATPR